MLLFYISDIFKSIEWPHSHGIIFCLIIRVNWDPGRREIILKIRQELESKTDILS